MNIFRRSENADDDKARTDRLLDGVDAAYAARTGQVNGPDLDEFEETVLFGAAGDPADPYPPPGHGYPRRRR